MVRTADIATPIITLIKHHDTIKEVINLTQKPNLKDRALGLCTRLSEIPLFLKMLEVCPVPDLELEEALISLRRILLLEKQKLSAHHNLLQFQK